jgi:DNA-binding MarR family transcriptional regulator
MKPEYGVQRLEDLAATIEATAESLAAVLDPSRCEQLAPVSPAQLRVLLLLSAQSNLNVNGLAEALHVVASSASRLCDRLEALGLLSRSSDPRDRREVQLRLTPAALDMLDELSNYRRRALESVLAAMSPAARRDLGRGLTAFSDAATEPEAADARASVRRSA